MEELYGVPTNPLVADMQCAVIPPPVEIVIPQLGVVAVTSEELITRTEKEYAPATVGVPVIAPVDAFRLKPGGNAPELNVKLNGAVPPTTPMEELYGVPTAPPVAGAHSAAIPEVVVVIVMPQLGVVATSCEALVTRTENE
jgi:hypothetical protein